MTERHGERPDTPVTEPAPTLTSKARSDTWVELDRRQNGAPPLDTRRVPCPTITAAALSKGIWKLTERQANGATRQANEPAMTITASADNGNFQWVHERPATTVCGDPRVWPPGHKVNQSDRDRLGEDEANERYGDRAGTTAIKLTVEEALTLQSFDPDYPVKGTRTKQFEQVGNAVPPLLALAVLRAVAA